MAKKLAATLPHGFRCSRPGRLWSGPTGRRTRPRSCSRSGLAMSRCGGPASARGPSAIRFGSITEGTSGIVLSLVADAAYSDGDPAFWRANLEINWEESWARENAVGGTSGLRDQGCARGRACSCCRELRACGATRARLRIGSPPRSSG